MIFSKLLYYANHFEKALLYPKSLLVLLQHNETECVCVFALTTRSS
jgi:hypothetical protein